MSVRGAKMQNAHAIFETGCATHVGRVRERNEDSFLARPEIGIWAVADGMGGHADGDVASQTLIRALASIERPASAAALLDLLEDSVSRANARLRELGKARGGVVGTTVAVLLVSDGYYACVWSGDSRIYMVRDGEIVQLSRDHTEVQDLLAEGSITAEEARNWAGRNGVTRAIGVYDKPELEMTSAPLSPGDLFVICSDGLTNHVQEDEILRCVSAGLSQQACDALIALTLERGALDNVTVIVARYQPGRAPRVGTGDAPDVREQAR
jgi:serine/threonine protein phosphatase PrpC